jgi:hypothetical protein
LAWKKRKTSPFAYVAAVPIFTWIGARTLLLSPLSWDWFTAHGVRPARWVQGAGFTYEEAPGVWDLFRHYFAGGEVFFAWAMLPTYSDQWVGWITFVQWLGLGIACWALARQIGVRHPFDKLFALGWSFVPTVYTQIGSGYVELAMVMPAIAGITALLLMLRRPDLGSMILIAMAFGVAAAVKLPGLLPAGLGGATMMLLLFRERDRRWAAYRWRASILVSLVLVIPLAPWLIFNTYETGYPLSPAPVSVLGARLGVPSPAMQWFQMRELEGVQYTLAGELGSLRKVIGDPRRPSPALGFFVPLWCIALPLGMWRLASRNPRACAFLALVMLANLWFYFLPGMGVARILWALSGGRYLLIALIIATCIAMYASKYSRTVAGMHLLLYGAGLIFHVCSVLGYGVGKAEYLPIFYIVVSGLGLLVALAIALRVNSRAALVALVVAPIAWSVFLHDLRVENRAHAFRRSYHIWPTPRNWVSAIPLVDTPDRSRRISVTGGSWQNADNWFTYALHGRHFQNEVIYTPVTEDGSIAHFGPGSKRRQLAAKDAWLRRLGERSVTEVMSFGPRSLEMDWMETNPEHFVRLAGNKSWGLWRFVPPPK